MLNLKWCHPLFRISHRARGSHVTYRMLVPVVLAFVLSGCGFHLRGQIEFSPLLAIPYVNGKNDGFVKALNSGLRQSGLVPAQDPSNATAIIDLTAVHYDRVVISIDSRGLAPGYQLSYTVSYRVVNRSGKVLLENSKITLKRNLTYQSTQVLQKQAEESALKDVMIEDMVRQIVRRLGSVSLAPTRAKRFALLNPQLQVDGS